MVSCVKAGHALIYRDGFGGGGSAANEARRGGSASDGVSALAVRGEVRLHLRPAPGDLLGHGRRTAAVDVSGETGSAREGVAFRLREARHAGG